MAVSVRDIMIPAPITARPETGVGEIARIMRDQDIGVVLIADGDVLTGLITDRDLAVRVLAANLDPHTPVRAVCSDRLCTVEPDVDIVEAAELMRNNAVRRLPVIEDGLTVGVVSLGDITVLSAPASALGGISAALPNT